MRRCGGWESRRGWVTLIQPSQQFVQDAFLKKAVRNRLAIECQAAFLESLLDLLHEVFANVRGPFDPLEGLFYIVCQRGFLQTVLGGSPPPLSLTYLPELLDSLATVSKGLPQEIHF